MNWTKLEVYNGDEFIGSTYSSATSKQGFIADINEEFGSNWTRYNVGN